MPSSNVVGVRGSKNPADAARTGKLPKIYTAAVPTPSAEAWMKKLGGRGPVVARVARPSVAAAEAALIRLIEFCERAEADSAAGG